METFNRQKTRQLLQFIASQYGLELVLSHRSLKKGFINDSWMIVTPKGHFVVRRCLRESRKLAFEVRLLDHLKPLPVPRVVHLPNRQAILRHQGSSYIVFRYIVGHHQQTLSLSLLRQLGGLLGRMHRLGRSFTFRSNREPLTHLFTPKKIRWFNRTVYPKLPSDLRQQYLAVRSAAQLSTLPTDLPHGPIHLDPKPLNILVRGNRLVGLIDFDFAHIGPYILEIGKALQRQCSHHGKIVPARIKALLAGYERYRPLTLRERLLLQRGFVNAVSCHLLLCYFLYTRRVISLAVTRGLHEQFFPLVIRYMQTVNSSGFNGIVKRRATARRAN